MSNERSDSVHAATVRSWLENNDPVTVIDGGVLSRFLSTLPYNRGTDEPTRESVLIQIAERRAA